MVVPEFSFDTSMPQKLSDIQKRQLQAMVLIQSQLDCLFMNESLLEMQNIGGGKPEQAANMHINKLSFDAEMMS